MRQVLGDQHIYRIQQIWRGFKEGFTKTIEEARPVFEDLVDALSEFGQQIASIFTGMTAGAASLPSAEFRSFGQIVGSAIGGLARGLTRLVAIVTRVTSGILGGFRGMMSYLRPAFAVVREAISDLGKAWDKLVGRTNDTTAAVNESTRSWRSLGNFLGKVFGGLVTVIVMAMGGLLKVLTAIVWVVRQVKDAFVAAGTWMGETIAKITVWFTETLPKALSQAIRTVTGFFQRIGRFFVRIGRWFRNLFAAIVQGIQSFLDPMVEFFRGIGRAIKNVFDGIRDFVIKLLRRIPDKLLPSSLEQLKRQPLSTEVRTEDEFEAVGRTKATAARAQAATASMPAAVATRGRRDEFAQLEANLLAFANARAKEQGQPPPFQIQVQVDGETIAQASHNASRDNAARAFSPIPSY